MLLYSSVDVSLPNYITYRTCYTRSSDLQFIEPDTAISAYKYNFFLTSIWLWNKLPSDVTSCDNIDTLKEHSICK